LFVDLNKYYLDYDTQPSEIQKSSTIIGSKIITDKHAELILKWINRMDVKDELKIQYELNLLLRGSRDGFKSGRFHELCDNKTHTLTIIKIKGGDEILGGYNPIEWNNLKSFSLPFYNTKESFIFSFKGKENIENCILSRVKDVNYAIKHWFYSGPSFGQTDLNINGIFFNQCNCSCKKNSYEKEIRETEDYFSIEEYEVFQVKKKINKMYNNM
ncbi:1398_t:CDS:1, partial [Funneliformis caledonium]